MRRIPKKTDLATTIGGEVVVSARLVEAFQKHGITGAEYRPVRHKTGEAQEEWRHRCLRKHVAGLNRLSEPWVQRAGGETSDWMHTRQLTGVRRGLLHPEEQLLISPLLYRVPLELKARRFEVEVAHPV
jgi:hypothetical protein